MLSDIYTEEFVMELNPDDGMDNSSHEDIFWQMSKDFGLPLLPDDLCKDVSPRHVPTDNHNRLLHNNVLNELLSLDSAVKSEPPSPTPSLNEPLGDSWSSVLNIPTSTASESSSNVTVEWKTLETPPISPTDHSQSSSPKSGCAALLPATLEEPTRGAAVQLPKDQTQPSIVHLQPASIGSGSGGVIQPAAVGANPQLTSTCIAPTKVGTVVLTQKDFLCLASQGISLFNPALASPAPLKQTPQANGVPSTNHPPAQVTPSRRPVQPASQIVRQEVDARVLKRQQRMIKNRESACLSRKKKRDYVQNLEAILKTVTLDNERLRFENEQLRHRLQIYEKRNPHLALSSSTKRKATALVAVVFMISMNLGPLSGIFMTGHRQMEPIETKMAAMRHGGRSLLWVTDVESEFRYDGAGGNSSAAARANLSDDVAFAAPLANETIGNSNPRSCLMFINRTESLRLDSELRGWIFGESKRSAIPVRTRQPSPPPSSSSPPTVQVSPPMKLGFEKNLPPLPRHKKYLRRESLPDDEHFQLKHELQIYQQGLPESYEDFLKAIKHREDTFYVVSFTGDHLLVPARAHNKTRRPLMSLVLPALSLNDSMEVPAHHVAMMQIECEVINTKLVNVKDSYIPSQGRRRQPLPPEHDSEPRRRSSGARRPRVRRSEIAKRTLN